LIPIRCGRDASDSGLIVFLLWSGGGLAPAADVHVDRAPVEAAGY
jgi:hypothetical protein